MAQYGLNDSLKDYLYEIHISVKRIFREKQIHVAALKLNGHVKGATKSYYTQYSCVVIVLFNTALCRSVFSTVSFRKLVFFLSFCAFFESRH